MKYLDVRLYQPDRMLHPMQEFIRYEDAVQYEELLTWNLIPDAPIEYELFYVEADEERYRAAIDAVESVCEYTITPIDADSFYVYACQETRPEDTRWRGAFAELNLVVVPPISYDEEAAMRITIVGVSEDLRVLLENLPDEVETTINGVGEYDRRRGTLAGGLTDRQYETVEVAADLGYYDVPRNASLAEVASELSCAESTASTHLRKAEATLVLRVVR